VGLSFACFSSIHHRQSTRAWAVLQRSVTAGFKSLCRFRGACGRLSCWRTALGLRVSCLPGYWILKSRSGCSLTVHLRPSGSSRNGGMEPKYFWSIWDFCGVTLEFYCQVYGMCLFKTTGGFHVADIKSLGSVAASLGAVLRKIFGFHLDCWRAVRL